MANSVDPDQTAPIYIKTVCSRSTLSAFILNSPVMLGNYLQQTTSEDDIFTQGGTLIFTAYVGSDPGSTVHPKNIRNLKHPKKIFEIFATQKNILILYI